MDEKELTYREASEISILVFVISAGIQFIFNRYLSFMILFFIGLTFILTMFGALLGKFLTTSRTGVWVGAIIGTILGHLVGLFFWRMILFLLSSPA